MLRSPRTVDVLCDEQVQLPPPMLQLRQRLVARVRLGSTEAAPACHGSSPVPEAVVATTHPEEGVSAFIE